MRNTMQRRLPDVGGVALMMLLALGGGCQRSPSGALGGMAADNTEAVLVMLSEARAWQRRADLLLIDGDVAGAIGAVKEVLEIHFPPNMPEAEDVRLDASVRLARLYLGTGGEEAEKLALSQIEAGRGMATRDSFFRAHLETVAADVYEARAKRLTDPEEQKTARRQALAALERSIAIDRRLQRSLLNLPAEPTRESGRGETR